ncbi:MAG: DNA polymerase [Candidatus Bathyarchaeia archaeon]
MNAIFGIDSETVKVRKRAGDKVVEEHVFLSFQVYPPPRIFWTSVEVESWLNTLPDKSLLIGWKAEFDLLVLRKILSDEWMIKFRRNKSRFVLGEITNGKKSIRVFDLYNLLPVASLRRVGEIIGCPKLERPDYLGERAPKTSVEKREFSRYAIRDAEICYKAYQMLKSQFGKDRPTLPSLALSVFNQSFGGRALFLKLPEEVVRLADKAYMGGRTECFWRGSPDFRVRLYDFNSLYPFAMMTGNFPFFRSYLGEKGNVNLDHTGIAQALIYQDAPIPLLGVRRKFSDGTVKLIFPSGKVKGVWTYPELRRLEQWGVGKILKIFRAVEWRETSNPFRKFIMEYYQKRMENPALSKIYKLFLNSLYGKFAQNPHLEDVYVEASGEVQRIAPDFFTLRNPVISCFITAFARLKLYKVFRRVGYDKIYYCDTDSVMTDTDLGGGSQELGALKLEGETDGSRRLTLVRSKCYIFNDVVKWKGLTLRSLEPISKRSAGETARLLISNNKFEVFETVLVKLIYSKRIKVPFLSELRRWKVFNLAPDGKRIFSRPLSGKELLEDWVSSQPLTLKNPEDENEVIKVGSVVE